MNEYPKIAIPGWMRDGDCLGMDTEIFFPDRGHDSRAARRICRPCPVKTKCLEFALSLPRNPYGIWGETTENDRKALRARARATATATAATTSEQLEEAS